MNKKRERVVGAVLPTNGKPYQTEIEIIPSPRVVSAFRSTDHNPGTGVADLVDNADDAAFSGHRVDITTESNEQGYTRIRIIDRGSGFEDIKEGLRLGSNSNKIRSFNLGCHGIGLSAGAGAIGDTFTIKTKHKDHPYYIVKMTVSEFEKQDNFKILLQEPNRESYEVFKEVVGNDTGTIIEITDIDRLRPYNHLNHEFEKYLEKQLGQLFFHRMKSGRMSIFLNDEKIEPIDLMHREFLNKKIEDGSDYLVQDWADNIDFIYQNHEFKLRVYWLHPEMVDKLKHSRFYPDRRNIEWNGIYPVRNDRLVGKALTLGTGLDLKNTHPYYAGLRIELHYQGDADYLFHATNTKRMHDSSAEEINQGLRDILEQKLQDYASRAKMEENKIGKERRTTKAFDQFSKYDKNINKNPRWRPGDKPVKTILDPDGSEYDPEYRWRIDQEEYTVIINENHSYWKKFLSKATNDTKMCEHFKMHADAAAWNSITDTKLGNMSRSDILEMYLKIRGDNLSILMSKFKF